MSFQSGAMAIKKVKLTSQNLQQRSIPFTSATCSLAIAPKNMAIELVMASISIIRWVNN